MIDNPFATYFTLKNELQFPNSCAQHIHAINQYTNTSIIDKLICVCVCNIRTHISILIKQI